MKEYLYAIPIAVAFACLLVAAFATRSDQKSTPPSIKVVTVEGRKYVVVSTDHGVALCPVTP